MITPTSPPAAVATSWNPPSDTDITEATDYLIDYLDKYHAEAPDRSHLAYLVTWAFVDNSLAMARRLAEHPELQAEYLRKAEAQLAAVSRRHERERERRGR